MPKELLDLIGQYAQQLAVEEPSVLCNFGFIRSTTLDISSASKKRALQEVGDGRQENCKRFMSVV